MYKMIIAVVERELIGTLTAEMRREGVHFTYSEAKGFGKEIRLYHEDTLDRFRIEIIAEDGDVERVKGIILSHVPKGTAGAGMLAIYRLEEFVEFSAMQ